MTSLDLQAKRVLIREDLNVPIQDGAVSSDARIRAALPTIQAALTAKARVLVMSHLGRPEEGKFAPEFSLAPVAKRLAQLLGVPVRLQKDWLDGVEVQPGEVVLLENVRFNKGEKQDADELAQKMVQPHYYVSQVGQRRQSVEGCWMLSASSSSAACHSVFDTEEKFERHQNEVK